MATAYDFIKRAFTISGIHADETDIEASEANDALILFNDMLAVWELKGSNLGFSPVAALADTVRVPRGAHEAINYNLGVRLGIEFDVPVTADIAAIAASSKRDLSIMFKKPLVASFPPTLPMGAGNRCDTDSRFFDGSEKENF
jgi:hypothetical protein